MARTPKVSRLVSGNVPCAHLMETALGVAGKRSTVP